MTVDSQQDLQALQRIGRIVGLTLQKMTHDLRPGMTTGELDEIGGAFLRLHGARSAPMLAYNFPGYTCISVNEVAAHGIPGDIVVRPGDLVNIDVSAELDGYFADTGGTALVPPAAPANQELCSATRSALWKAIHSVKAGAPLNCIGKAVESEARRRGFGLIRDLTGHGVGRALHEEPRAIYNFYEPHDRRLLAEGMVLAIEPFLTLGNGHIIEESDGWTLRTVDRKPLAQYEHTVVVTRGQPIVVTAI